MGNYDGLKKSIMKSAISTNIYTICAFSGAKFSFFGMTQKWMMR